MTNSKVQIIATLGPASSDYETLKAMIEHNMDIVRLNFSWSDLETRTRQIELVRQLGKECGRHIPIMIDLPGPRIQNEKGHTYNSKAQDVITEDDKQSIKFGVEHSVNYIAVSFVSGPKDIEMCRDIIKDCSGKQGVIAKIERKVAFDVVDSIIEVADAIMVARGDLGNEIPLEQIPFVQETIIRKCKDAGKPVITATQMLFSMVSSPKPTRAEVTDVASAILQGSDAVMLSEETAKGEYPVESVIMMEKIVMEALRHMEGKAHINLL